MEIRNRDESIGSLVAKNVLAVGLAVCILGGVSASPAAWAANSPQLQDRPWQVQSKQNIWLDVDQDSQLVRVMRGNTPIRVMIASTGRPNTPTPNGTFQIQNRGPFFSVEYASAKYFTSFKGWGEYMFHSIIFDKKGKRIQAAAAERLGFKASHGCIRLPIHDAWWINKNIPQGTKVVIHSKPAPVSQKQGAGKKLPAFSLEVDGKRVNFSKKPRWLERTLMVPVNDLARWIGGTVEWDDVIKLVTIFKDGTPVQFPVSIPRMTVAGQDKELKIPALLIYKTVWMPFEQIASALGYRTKWEDQANHLIAASAKYSPDAKSAPASTVTAKPKADALKPLNVLINGRPADIKLPPREEKGQLLVPITPISQALGAQVSQEVYQRPNQEADEQGIENQATQNQGTENQATQNQAAQDQGSLLLKVIWAGQEIVFYPGSELYQVNGVTYKARLPVRQLDGQQFMGLQDLAEAFTFNAVFNPATGTVSITTADFRSGPES